MAKFEGQWKNPEGRIAVGNPRGGSRVFVTLSDGHIVTSMEMSALEAMQVSRLFLSVAIAASDDPSAPHYDEDR